MKMCEAQKRYLSLFDSEESARNFEDECIGMRLQSLPDFAQAWLDTPGDDDVPYPPQMWEWFTELALAIDLPGDGKLSIEPMAWRFEVTPAGLAMLGLG